ncbi:G-protein coupled receptor 161 [Protopterus annectens]|uniref:G-protein coupled receptor 161 n=1 Tax=Protopterus annectens TaxID=7888 RepID=UPI001CFBA4FE|nr:G-protein coupled receptor 161 [Protopterus annectens]
MLLEDFTSDSCQQKPGSYPNRRRSSVTFEDEAEQISKESSKSSSFQLPIKLSNSLDNYASSLAKAIEADARIVLFGEDSIPGTLSGVQTVFGSAGSRRGSRMIAGERPRMESIDEGIVNDGTEEEHSLV